MKALKVVAIIMILGGKVCAQNVGINSPSPSEKLEVGGIIYTNQGGVKFPDETIQTTAAMSSTQIPNSIVRKQPYLTFPLTAGLPDTFEILKIVKGGTNVVLSAGGSAGGSGIPKIIPFNLIVNLEKSSDQLFQSLVQSTVLQKATIHYTQTASPLVYKTIELRNVVISDFISSTDYLGQNKYGHLVELTLNFHELEMRNFSPSSCFCWDFATNNTCTCD